MTKGKAIINDSAFMLQVNYEDFEVEEFGGSDYEVTYTLDGKNRDKLEASLRKDGNSGKLSKMIISHFGSCLDKDSFAAYCDERKIEYDLFTWVG